MEGPDSARETACRVIAGYVIWNPRPVLDMNTRKLADRYFSIRSIHYRWYIYLSITYKVPCAPSSVLNPSRGGSSVTETFSSLWHSLGGMSLKDVGVVPTIFLCSSGPTNMGRDVVRVAAGIMTTQGRD